MRRVKIIALSLITLPFKIASVLVRLDNVLRFITAKLRVSDCVAARVWLSVPQASER